MKEQKPNILFIFTDQQSASMMSCAGNAWLKTPAMDSLAASGVRFDRAYCTNPVCVPSRFSLMTGRMPGEIGLRSNAWREIDPVPELIVRTGAGWVLGKAGYDAGYGGKVHLPQMTPEDIGFEFFCKDQRDLLPDACADFVQRKRDKPFFLAASFINPHDICYMTIRDFAQSEFSRRLVANGRREVAELDKALGMADGIDDEEFFRNRCPALPDNHERQQDEPEAVERMVAMRDFRKMAREQYTEREWRMHRWAYCRLTEQVDAHIGRVLDALRTSGQEENTVVIFSSDHGDMDSAHRMEHKTVLYEEACRVPLIIRQPGALSNEVNRTVVSNGLDLLPTFCDYAGVEPPAGLTGVSLRPLVENSEACLQREFVPIDSEFGKAVVCEDFKYALYDAGRNREQLYCLKDDAGEMRNEALEAKHQTWLRIGRKMHDNQFTTKDTKNAKDKEKGTG